MMSWIVFVIGVGIALLKHVDLDGVVVDRLIEISVLSGDMDECEGEKTGQTKGNAADGNHRPEESMGRLLDVCSPDSVFHSV